MGKNFRVCHHEEPQNILNMLKIFPYFSYVIRIYTIIKYLTDLYNFDVIGKNLEFTTMRDHTLFKIMFIKYVTILYIIRIYNKIKYITYVC